MHKNVRLVNKVDIASQVMAIVTSVIAMGCIYYYTAIIICMNIITRPLRIMHMRVCNQAYVLV